MERLKYAMRKKSLIVKLRSNIHKRYLKGKNKLLVLYLSI